MVFGTNANGKVKVTSFFDKNENQWLLKKADLYTKTDKIKLI